MAKTATGRNAEPRIHIGLLGYDGCSAWIVAGSLELFELASVLSARIHGDRRIEFKARVVSPLAPTVSATGGIRFSAIRTTGQFSVLIVPPIWHKSQNDLIGRLQVLKPLLHKMPSMARRSRVLASACSGSVLLAEAGLLDGRSVTTCWWLKDWFRLRYPNIDLQTEALVIADGSTWTAGAGSAYVHLCLRIIEQFGGSELAGIVARFALAELNRETQAPFFLSQFQRWPADEVIDAVREYVHSHVDSSINIADAAAAANVSPRTLFRRFHGLTNRTPLDFIREAKIERAKHLMCVTHNSVELIASQCGYVDVTSFRKLFHSAVGMTPGEYRKRFGIARTDPKPMLS
jgi:transcriptional regulator GlxA family with amidase domain